MTQQEKKLSIQQAAAYLIRQKKAPMTAQEIVQKAQEMDLVRQSRSQNPSNSFIQTLERNIRMKVGNNPALRFVYDDFGTRFIDLDAAGDDKYEREIEVRPIQKKKVTVSETNSISNSYDQEILPNIKLYMLANQLTDETEAINELLKFAIKEKMDDTLGKIKKMADGIKKTHSD